MIGLADCNNFYASCERIFHPEINNKPVLVLSNNDGCVIARSDESKALGIKMGEPVFKIKGLIKENKINVFSSNFPLYGDLSRRVMRTLQSELKAIEIYSIDEAFLDFSDYLSLERVLSIRKKVQKWTGIPISIGVAPNKTLAKVANHIAKKEQRGVFILDNKLLIKKVLNDFPVESLWGIGRKYARRLKVMNIKTALELRDANPLWLRKCFSINTIKLQNELKGALMYNLNNFKTTKKSICTSQSFGREIKGFNNLHEAISNFASNSALKLRRENSYCSKISVFLMTNRFNLDVKQYNPSITLAFDTPTNDSMEIINKSKEALKLIYSHKFSYKKAGVVLHANTKNKQIQMSFFDNINRVKRNKLMESIDSLNLTLGKNKIRFASQGFNEKWQSKRQKLSPSYTTKYDEILTIKI